MSNERQATLTRAEAIFFDRCFIKMVEQPTLTLEQAAKQVCDDDKRIASEVFNREDVRKAVSEHLVRACYDKVREALAEASKKSNPPGCASLRGVAGVVGSDSTANS